MKLKKLISLGLASTMILSLAACGNGNSENAGTDSGNTSSEANAGSTTSEVPDILDLKLGEDYTDLTASIKILTNRTDMKDYYQETYVAQFNEKYPNITVEYEAITDYEESLTLRLTTGDWGDICFIPSTVDKDELSTYFAPLGDYDSINEVYNFVQSATSNGTVYGIPNGGTASGVAYNAKVWEDAGVTEMPTTPDEFLEDLQKIKDNTDAIPLYTNFSAGWTMGAWSAYAGVAATGDADFLNNKLLHMKDPFSKNDDMTGPYAVYYVLYESVARGLVEEDPASSDWESSKTKINNGEIGTMVLGSWCVSQFKEAGDNPDDIKYMPFPISVDGKQYAAAGGDYAYAINNKADTENQIASMLYIKWLLDESTIFTDEGQIPARKDGELPDFLSDFEGVELLQDNPAAEGEESLYDDLCNESEVLKGDYPVSDILEAALYGTSTLDEKMDEWNKKWTAAQDNLGVEIKE